jgi:SAM-dependent methyltransferase
MPRAGGGFGYRITDGANPDCPCALASVSLTSAGHPEGFAPETILDIGCGPGMAALLIARRTILSRLNTMLDA